MGEPIISASRDSRFNWEGRKISDGVEHWHLPREMEPNRPLCGASLSGVFKRSKGNANCGTCISRATLSSIDDRYHGVLRALYLGTTLGLYKERYMTHEPLIEADVVYERKGTLYLTTVGKALARDVIDPVGWYDAKTRLFHTRRPMTMQTTCGLPCGHAHTRGLLVENLSVLHADAKKRGRRTVTCVRCAIHVEPRGDMD